MAAGLRYHSCHSVEAAAPRTGREVVVAGGRHQNNDNASIMVLVFNMDLRAWRNGSIGYTCSFFFTCFHKKCLSKAPLPNPIELASVVPFENTFLLVGGQISSGNRLNTVYKFT